MEKDVLFCDSADTKRDRKSDEVLELNGAPTQTTDSHRAKRKPHSKKRVLKIVLLTVLPICFIAFAIGILLAVEYISKKSEYFQVSNSSEFAVFKDEGLMNQSRWVNSTANITTLLVSPFVTSANPPWRDCGSKLSKVLAVHSEDCPLQDGRCQLPVGTEGLIEIMFQVTQAVSAPVQAMNVTMCGSPAMLTSLGLPCVESKPKEPDPCRNSNLQCPLYKDEKYVYRMLGGLKKEDLPSIVTFDIDVNLYIRLIDYATKQLVVCVMMPVTITM